MYDGVDFTIYLKSKDIKKQIAEAAEYKGISMSEWAREALEEKLKREEKERQTSSK